jgi:hypothetical protein
MEHVKALMPIGASQSPNLSQVGPNYSSVRRIIEKLEYFKTFEQVLHKIRPLQMEHNLHYTSTFNGRTGKH